MRSCDRLAGVPLEGGRLDREMGVAPSPPCKRVPDTVKRPVLIAVVGQDDSELVVWMLRRLLEGMPRTRVGAIAPDGVWLAGKEQHRGDMDASQLLEHMTKAGCTHIVLQLDEPALERGICAELRMSVTALMGAVKGSRELARLLENSDTVVLDLDEAPWAERTDLVPKHTFTYSENKDRADLTARNLRLYPGHMEFEAVGRGHIQRIHLPVPGGMTLYHGLCVLACGECLGLQRERMARILRSVPGPARRLEVLPVPAAYTVVQDRADDPRGLERSLIAARTFTAGQLICVLRCPGGRTPTELRQLGGVAELLADRIVLTAQEQASIDTVRSGMGERGRPCITEPDVYGATVAALDRAGPGDVVVLAGQPDLREFVCTYVANRPVWRSKKG